MKVYSPPTNVKVPDFMEALDENGRYSHEKDEELNAAFFADLKASLIASGYTGPLTGEVLYFPQGDGSAIYMVADAPRKMALIHCPLGDAWSLPDWQTDGITKKVVLERIESHRRINALFGRK